MSIYTFSEAELRSRFIKNIGNRDDIDVYIEVPVFCRSVDLVIQEKQNAEIFAIEFKLHDWKRAIQQAQSVGLCFDYLYICLPKPKTNSSASKISDTCISNGVGLIIFVGYSLPIADFEFRYMLQKNVTSSAKIDVILTPNSNPDLVANNLKDLLPSKRYLDAFPKNKVSFYYEGFGPFFSLSK